MKDSERPEAKDMGRFGLSPAMHREMKEERDAMGSQDQVAEQKMGLPRKQKREGWRERKTG